MAYSDKINKSRSKKSKVVADEMTSFNYIYYLLVLITGEQIYIQSYIMHLFINPF